MAGQILAAVLSHGGRVTPAKRILVGILLRSQCHRSVEDIAGDVQRVAPDVHLTTVYRILEELERF